MAFRMEIEKGKFYILRNNRYAVQNILKPEQATKLVYVIDANRHSGKILLQEFYELSNISIGVFVMTEDEFSERFVTAATRHHLAHIDQAKNQQVYESFLAQTQKREKFASLSETIRAMLA
jgi:hypothetical protein